jgi:hypothetical protein
VPSMPRAEVYEKGERSRDALIVLRMFSAEQMDPEALMTFEKIKKSHQVSAA